MIVALCSDKGAPGVSTLAAALALRWPGPRILLEADPSGGDAVLRMHRPRSQSLDLEPSILSLAGQVRTGARVQDLTRFAQVSSLGLPVVPGPLQAEDWAAMAHLWPQVSAQVEDWDGTVFADLGRLHPDSPGLALALRADVVLVLTNPSAESYFHVRRRTEVLSTVLGGRPGRNPVGVVVRTTRRERSALGDVAQMLRATGSPVPVVGALADDPSGVGLLGAGADTARLRRSALMRSVADLIGSMRRTWGIGDVGLDGPARSGSRRVPHGGPDTAASWSAR